MNAKPGDIWLADLGLAAKTRPVLIISRFDPDAPRALFTYLPLTTQHRGSRYEIQLGDLPFLHQTSVVNVQGIGSLIEPRLERKLGQLWLSPQSVIASHDVVEGGLVLILAALLEGGEVMLNGVEIGRVRRQEQQRGTGDGDELRRLWRFVKGRIIEDDEMLGVEAWAQPRLQPGVEDHRIAGALEEQRFFESSVHTGGKQRGPWPSMPGD